MPRPRKDSGEKGADERMVEVFWDQLSHMPYREITATSVARRAGCNRATFYYYFDSIEDLAERAVDAAVPSGIADLVEAFLASGDGTFGLDEAQRRAVERVCLLAGENGSKRLTERFKRALMAVWVERFGLDLEQEDVWAVASFMASGIVGMLGEWAGRPCDAAFDARLRVIGEVFSASAIKFAHGAARGITHGAVRPACSSANPPPFARPQRVS